MQTLGDLQDAIQRELAWRKQEVSAVRTLAVQADESARHIFRSGQVLLCAHWEGFLKQAAKLYLDHVFAQEITVRQLTPTFVAVRYFSDVMKAASAKYPGSEQEHIRLAEEILDTFDSLLTKPGWKVDTEGNPGSDVVERVLRSIGMDPQLGMDAASWGTTRVFINEQLVRERNAVAHGEGMRIGKESFLERSQRLLELLDRLTDELMATAQRRSYLSDRV